MILSFILIIPIYWAYKKFKFLKINKEKLKGEIDICKLEKAKNKLMEEINISILIDKCYDVFQFQEQVPITKELLKKMNYKSNFFDIHCSENSNPYRTS